MEKDLIEMARESRNNYARQWRASNKDKVKEANVRYRLKKAKEKEVNK